MTRAQFESFVSEGGDKSGIEFDDINTPVPEGLPLPGLYRMFLMPVGVKRSLNVSGTDKKIILADESVDANKWLNAIGRICAMGPACFKHPRYKDLDLKDEDFPKVGDLILYTGKAPNRLQFRNTPILVINDDQWFGRIMDESTVPYFKFYV